MNHTMNLEIHASAHRSDLLAEAHNIRLARSDMDRSAASPERRPRPRLRYGLATTIVAATVALATALVGPF
ncbi:MAG: hypothetical protein H0W60_04030 [Chloroflexi bacterium]|jgi:hypothetical protein|nr:hypothetical protein [Chloroflexota bacterium]MBA3959450.1 hypothetical protein [Chloroflexota bacterium]